MRTTIDIPDALFREIKATAVLRGETLKSFLLKAAKTELESGAKSTGVRVILPIVRSKEASYDLSSERIAELQEEEDLEVATGH